MDRGIRFVGVANREGKLIAHAYRKGIVPLLTPQETEVSVLQSFIRMGTRATLEQKIGETVYAFTMYRKVKRVTIPLRNSSKITHIFMVSFDLDVDHEPIIINKIIPELENLVL
ncbi:MAG: hypothetical protein HXY31_06530 [Nitrososphaera sp.]|nr:hypothetical protein [Nitrososphaera sp.]